MVLWVFGYGSLIWNPSFSSEERLVAYVKGYRRAFHQACIDFRGTPESPGRSLTLEEEEGAVTWGVAYRVSACDEAEMVEAYLNQRERTYDVRAFLDLYTPDSPDAPKVQRALTYISTSSNSNRSYLGPAPLAVMAEQIAKSRGPAGENYEYLFHLEKSLMQIGAECIDHETVQLANEVRKILVRPSIMPQKLTSEECDGARGLAPPGARLLGSGWHDYVLILRRVWGTILLGGGRLAGNGEYSFIPTLSMIVKSILAGKEIGA